MLSENSKQALKEYQMSDYVYSGEYPKTPSVAGEYQFSNEWFTPNQPIWNMILPQISPKKFLEIGSWEGRSACWIINKFAKIHDIEVHCIDSWEGSNDDAHIDRAEVARQLKENEKRFYDNTALAVQSNPFKTDFHVHKGLSVFELSKLLVSDYDDYFDFIYVDAAHTASAALDDIVLSWKLLKHGGIMCVDDYIFAVQQRPRWDVPKTAIDAFVNIHVDDGHLLAAPNGQVFLQKVKREYTHLEK